MFWARDQKARTLWCHTLSNDSRPVWVSRWIFVADHSHSWCGLCQYCRSFSPVTRGYDFNQSARLFFARVGQYSSYCPSTISIPICKPGDLFFPSILDRQPDANLSTIKADCDHITTWSETEMLLPIRPHSCLLHEVSHVLLLITTRGR